MSTPNLRGIPELRPRNWESDRMCFGGQSKTLSKLCVFLLRSTYGGWFRAMARRASTSRGGLPKFRPGVVDDPSVAVEHHRCAARPLVRWPVQRRSRWIARVGEAHPGIEQFLADPKPFTSWIG